ncbi:34890_t:CDS:2, partial [Gigaspora margarita]
EAKIPAKSDNILDSIFLLSLLIYIKTVNENFKILTQIEQEIERIKSSNLEGNSSLNFFKKTVHAMPSTPIKIR